MIKQQKKAFVEGYVLGLDEMGEVKVSDKLKVISESKILLTIPIDDVFRLTVHAQYSEDTMFMEQYNSGWGSIYAYAEMGLSGCFTYPVYRKCLNVWMVCWKNNVPQYAVLIGCEYKSDHTSSWSVYTEDNNYFNILYYTTYYRPIHESLNGDGGGVFDFGTNKDRFYGYWNGNITAVMSFYEETYTYEPKPNNIGIGSIKMTDKTSINFQVSMGRFNVVPGYNGTITHLPFEELKNLVEDLCIAILNANGFKGERLTVLKPD